MNTDGGSLDYVRSYYRVPANVGGRVTVDGRAGRIIGGDGQYLLVRFDGELWVSRAHPTWRVEYLGGNQS